MHHAVAEPAFVDELELDVHVGRQRPVAATEDDRPDEQLALVDQTRLERLGGEVRTAHEEIGAAWCRRAGSEPATIELVAATGSGPAATALRAADDL